MLRKPRGYCIFSLLSLYIKSLYRYALIRLKTTALSMLEAVATNTLVISTV